MVGEVDSLDKLIVSLYPISPFIFSVIRLMRSSLYQGDCVLLKVLFDLWSYNKVGNGIISLSCACDEHCQLLSFIWMRHQLICNEIFLPDSIYSCISSEFHRLGCYIICFKHICKKALNTVFFAMIDTDTQRSLNGTCIKFFRLVLHLLL